ncbi:hypothetical protein TNCV_1058741 [Trichonephila clavipes]|nr:hypothetical protein TNCV_1058741 [Trichonephila clavipes]
MLRPIQRGDPGKGDVYAAWAVSYQCKGRMIPAAELPPEVTKSRVSDPPAEKKNEEKKPKAVSPPPPPPHPRSKGRKAKRSVDADGLLPSNLFEKFALARLPLNPFFREEVPVVTKKPRIPPFFVSQGRLRQVGGVSFNRPLLSIPNVGKIPKGHRGRRCRDYRALSKWLESSGGRVQKLHAEAGLTRESRY